jgi:competence ComEA-like helix-hairpin-helix protein
MQPLLLGLMVSAVSMPGLSGSVDLNIATAAEITEDLHGIDLAKAHKIIEYRKWLGPIDTPEELLVIKGMEEKTLEKNCSRIITRLI